MPNEARPVPSSITVRPPSGTAVLLAENENVWPPEFAVNIQVPTVSSKLVMCSIPDPLNIRLLDDWTGASSDVRSKL